MNTLSTYVTIVLLLYSLRLSFELVAVRYHALSYSANRIRTSRIPVSKLQEQTARVKFDIVIVIPHASEKPHISFCSKIESIRSHGLPLAYTMIGREAGFMMLNASTPITGDYKEILHIADKQTDRMHRKPINRSTKPKTKLPRSRSLIV